MKELQRRQRQRCMTVAEFCRDYSLSKTKAYELMYQRKLRSFKVGAKRLITNDAAEDWLASVTSSIEEVV